MKSSSSIFYLLSLLLVVSMNGILISAFSPSNNKSASCVHKVAVHHAIRCNNMKSTYLCSSLKPQQQRNQQLQEGGTVRPFSSSLLPSLRSSSPLSLPLSLSSNNINEEDNTIGTKWTHSDIEWRLRPPEDTPLIEKMKLQAAAKAIRAECLLREQPVPPVLCPKGGRALLEAYDKKNNKKKQIARFGITTTRGPPAPPMDETIQDIYGVTPPFGGAGIAAIIYMFVEPEYRKLGIGELALEAIAAIQIVQNCDFTVLVADDDGSNKLIEWYERNGFTQAPKLQDIFGSPGGKYGVTMIRPTQVASDIFARCQIVWW